MPNKPKRPLSELHPGDRVQVIIASHEPWGVMAELSEYEWVGASLDTIRRAGEPGVRRLADDLPPVGGAIELVVGQIRPWHREPWVWVDLTNI